MLPHEPRTEAVAAQIVAIDLRVDRFKGLRDVDLVLPPRGGVLVILLSAIPVYLAPRLTRDTGAVAPTAGGAQAARAGDH